jgi:hypothetical protein
VKPITSSPVLFHARGQEGSNFSRSKATAGLELTDATFATKVHESRSKGSHLAQNRKIIRTFGTSSVWR